MLRPSEGEGIRDLPNENGRKANSKRDCENIGRHPNTHLAWVIRELYSGVAEIEGG